MPKLDFLTDTHEEYTARKAEWEREERRLYGADAVLKDPLELPKWVGEETTHYLARLGEAQFLPLPEIHASIIAGHVGRVRQELSYGGLGERRDREKIVGTPNISELIHFNVNGVGSDGTELPAWTDGVQTRACATGRRWVYVEAPQLPGEAQPTMADVLRGFRPYAVEDSPLAWPMWSEDKGRLDWAVKRLRVSRSRMVAGSWEKANPAELGFYLFVRQGATDLGPDFEKGGWWLYAPDQTELGYGSWQKTRGDIPLFRLIGDDSQGAPGYPASDRSLTAPLGAIAVALMRRISHRNFNADDCAKGLKLICGTNPSAPELFNHTVQMMGESFVAPVHAWESAKGNVVIPTIYNNAAGAIEEGVFRSIIEQTLASAKEIMLRQVTEPQESGTSRELAFAGAVSPLLGKLAARRQAFENTLIYFFELRAGIEEPSGYSVFKREVPLQPIIDDIDRMIKTLQSLGVKSPTLATHLALRAGTVLGQIPDKDRAKIEGEIKESAESAAEIEDADAALIGAITGTGPRTRIRGAQNANGNAAGGTSGNGATGDGVETDDTTSRATERTEDEGAGAGSEALAQQLEAIQSSMTALGDQVTALAEQLRATQGQQPLVPPITLVMPQENGVQKSKRIEITKTEQGGYTATVTPDERSA